MPPVAAAAARSAAIANRRQAGSHVEPPGASTWQRHPHSAKHLANQASRRCTHLGPLRTQERAVANRRLRGSRASRKATDGGGAVDWFGNGTPLPAAPASARGSGTSTPRLPALPSQADGEGMDPLSKAGRGDGGDDGAGAKGATPRTIQIWDSNSPMISNSSGVPVLNSGRRRRASRGPTAASAAGSRARPGNLSAYAADHLLRNAGPDAAGFESAPLVPGEGDRWEFLLLQRRDEGKAPEAARQLAAEAQRQRRTTSVF
eukprot:SAG31_NODE_3370_length_4353_cov_5.039962_8_plen_261_part_00